MASLKLCVELIADERWLGGLIYVENLLVALSGLPPVRRPEVELSVLSSPAPHLVERLTRLDIVRNDARPAPFVERAWRFLDRKLGHRPGLVLDRLGLGGKRRGCDLWFPALGRALVPRPELYWIPDFQHHYLPHLFSRDELEMRSRCYGDIAGGSGLLLLSSRTALEDFNQHYPDAKVQTRIWSFCSNIALGDTGSAAAVLARHKLPAKYLYIPNQFWQHKDHLTAFEAVRRLRDQGFDIPLVCTGFHGDYRDAGYFPRVEKFLADHGLQGQIRLLGVVPREEQLEIFRSAALVVQPSLFEGWSTVIEDAKAIGRPVLASDIRIHREQLTGVEGAGFFPAGDAAALAGRIAALWPDLAAGSDAARERAAAVVTAQRRIESAEAFIAIAREAAALFRAGAH